MRYLCISDIHGHAAALSAVLATAERSGYDEVLVAGDICFPGPEPLKTWRRLTQLKARCVQGVGDRAIATLDETTFRPRDEFERMRMRRLLDVRAELGDSLLTRLAKLPTMRQWTVSGRLITLVHGSPHDPLEPFTHDMQESVVRMLLGEEAPDLVLCGGSHVAFDRRLMHQGKETRIINLGSVGEAPNATGPPVAHATLVDVSAAGVFIEPLMVPLGQAA